MAQTRALKITGRLDGNTTLLKRVSVLTTGFTTCLPAVRGLHPSSPRSRSGPDKKGGGWCNSLVALGREKALQVARAPKLVQSYSPWAQADALLQSRTLHVAQAHRVVKNEGVLGQVQALVQSKTLQVALAWHLRWCKIKTPWWNCWALARSKTLRVVQALSVVQNEGPFGQGQVLDQDTSACCTGI